MSVTNPGADNLYACLPLWTNTSKLECGPNQTLFGDNENSTQELGEYHAKFWKFCDPLDNVVDFACDNILDGITS